MGKLRKLIQRYWYTPRHDMGLTVDFILSIAAARPVMEMAR